MARTCCGVEIKPGQHFCPNCGTQLAKVVSPLHETLNMLRGRAAVCANREQEYLAKGKTPASIKMGKHAVKWKKRYDALYKLLSDNDLLPEEE